MHEEAYPHFYAYKVLTSCLYISYHWACSRRITDNAYRPSYISYSLNPLAMSLMDQLWGHDPPHSFQAHAQFLCQLMYAAPLFCALVKLNQANLKLIFWISLVHNEGFSLLPILAIPIEDKGFCIYECILYHYWLQNWRSLKVRWKEELKTCWDPINHITSLEIMVSAPACMEYKNDIEIGSYISPKCLGFNLPFSKLLRGFSFKQPLSCLSDYWELI